ncbi:dihydrolipoamide acetyltransferase family protein [Ureibacillus sinduriensis]|uniref:Dihydrolipoamide acetyltransferase component of pyruvate dehydrogenase complex n=1 Tax=Ureibacillus sinduriensis BLB-1 = JCM 15800 TaxID=1384057 RepID=A0A0A3HQ01_9BACL|nr:dihydrolipoamide acetyltransferase family protein [Ureibacillus sinduriensis]KGR74661.1 branched-chain alpha-keto acid dehydrogenase subunit E2 [Ureibacillus sinduriensis BLB-1 = JCM 15800]
MSIENILMPQLGESVTEGTIEKWLVKPGDKVNKYDPIAEVVTDKVNAEIPSSFTGTIKELIATEGEALQVGTIICSIETANEGTGDSPTVQLQNSNAVQTDSSVSKQEKKEVAQPDKKVPNSASKKRYSPAVLRLAEEYNIDLQLVEGTGLEGRITRKDLQKLIDNGQIPKPEPLTNEAPIQQVEVQQTAVGSKNVPVFESAANDIEIPVSSVRRAIAKNMVRTAQEVPHAWMMMEVDVTNLVSYRDAIKNEFKSKEGFNLTYFAFFIKAIARALKEFPMMNSVWADDKIIQKKDIHISIAVATEDALFVPVIKHADEKSIKGIAKEIHELSILVRNGKLRQEHIQGGTFTVNNTGSFGSVQSMGIINYPQAAIIQVESIVKRPVIMEGGMFAARDMVNLCLSLDHRILDGLICGKFLNRVKDILENVNKDTMSVY